MSSSEGSEAPTGTAVDDATPDAKWKSIWHHGAKTQGLQWPRLRLAILKWVIAEFIVFSGFLKLSGLRFTGNLHCAQEIALHENKTKRVVGFG